MRYFRAFIIFHSYHFKFDISAKAFFYSHWLVQPPVFGSLFLLLTMDMSSTDNSSMTMSTTFSKNENTPLWLQALTPASEANYAGAIIGLILLGIANRGISAGRSLCVRYSLARIETIGELKAKWQARSEEEVSEEEERITKAYSAPPFKWRYDIPRTLIAGLEAFTGYLLMLAVMTFDVGYFFAAIGGIMLGELVFGRYIVGASVAGHSH